MRNRVADGESAATAAESSLHLPEEINMKENRMETTEGQTTLRGAQVAQHTQTGIANPVDPTLGSSLVNVGENPTAPATSTPPPDCLNCGEPVVLTRAYCHKCFFTPTPVQVAEPENMALKAQRDRYAGLLRQVRQAMRAFTPDVSTSDETWHLMECAKQIDAALAGQEEGQVSTIHDHTCRCGTSSSTEAWHLTGEQSCVRRMTEAPLLVAKHATDPNSDRWLVDGHEITGFTLIQQRGYYQHPCGCWSWTCDSTNSIDA